MSAVSGGAPTVSARPIFAIDWVRLAPALYTVALFVIWEVAVRLSGLPHTILPAPSRIFESIIQYWSPIWKNSVQTLYTTTLGFLIAVVTGLGIGPEPVQRAAGFCRAHHAGCRRHRHVRADGFR